MKKIRTLFPKNKENLKLVIADNPIIDLRDNYIKPYLKIDGRACAIFDGKLYTRYDAKLIKRKRGKIIKRFTKEEIQKKLPKNSISCQEPDELSGHWPHWIQCELNNKDHSYIFEAYNNTLKFLNKKALYDGTYECVGPSINANPHNLNKHYLIRHLNIPLDNYIDDSIYNNDLIHKIYTEKDFKKLYEYFKNLMNNIPFEGIVFWDIKKLEPICKIRKSDFDLPTGNYSDLGLNKKGENDG